MTKAVIDILGPGVLMHQSDYPHGEAHFPDTAQIVLDWPIWRDLGGLRLRAVPARSPHGSDKSIAKRGRAR